MEEPCPGDFTGWAFTGSNSAAGKPLPQAIGVQSRAGYRGGHESQTAR
jgi:hypothetical protein